MYKIALLALLTEETSAHHATFRPIPGTNPWHGEVLKNPVVEFPHNYFVPNFGVDHEILTTHSNMDKAEKKLKTKWNPTQDKDGKWIVPTETNDVIKNKLNLQYGESSLLDLQSDPICGSGGCEKTLPEGPEGHPS